MEREEFKKVKKIYKEKIKHFANSLNSLQDNSSPESTIQILNLIRKTDLQFLQQNGIMPKGHIMFSRHGRCSNWSEKKFGINPNAALAEDAVAAMKDTHLLTKGLLVFPQKQLIAGVSPMVRAKQTACMILPSGVKNRIKIEPALTQNSNKPSSSYITSKQELQQEYESVSGWKKPKKALLYKLSSIFYGDQATYQKFLEISKKTDQKMIQKQEDHQQYFQKAIFNQQLQSYTFDVKNLDKKTKVTQMNNFITQHSQNCDVWLIGHSKNLKKFYEDNLGISNRFEFCETRSLYLIGEEKYFSPCYYLVVDQDSGKVRAKYDTDYFSLKKEKDV